MEYIITYLQKMSQKVRISLLQKMSQKLRISYGKY